MSGDILEKAPSRIDLADDPEDVRPEVPLVGRSPPLPCCGERLTGIPGDDGIDEPAPGPSAEEREIVENRSGSKIPCTLAGDEDLPRVFLDLDEAGGGKARLGKLKAHVKSTAARTEGDASGGR